MTASASRGPSQFHKTPRLGVRSLEIQQHRQPCWSCGVAAGVRSVHPTLLLSRLNCSISRTRPRAPPSTAKACCHIPELMKRPLGRFYTVSSNQVTKSRTLRVPNPHPFYSNPLPHYHRRYTTPLPSLKCGSTTLLVSLAHSTSPCTGLYCTFHHLTACRFKRLKWTNANLKGLNDSRQKINLKDCPFRFSPSIVHTSSIVPAVC